MSGITLKTDASAHGLSLMGISRSPAGPTVVLLGAAPALWPIFTASREYADGLANPLDRWSKRIIGRLAAQYGAGSQYPSDGPPYPPFIRWALESGQFFQSPTGMMVHPHAGLMISLRGALLFEDWDVPITGPVANPCDTCVDKPCLTACPVAALSGTAPYDVPTCKAYLDTAAGAECMNYGCAVRRICPLSQNFGRSSAQSAYHMRHFQGV